MSQITVTLPDGSTQGVRPRNDARGRRGGDRVPARRRRRWPPRSTASGSTSTGRSTPTPRVEIVVPASDDGREVLRHSTAHVMAEAVTRLFPGAKYTIGPAIADGFYYDFDLPERRDLPRRRPRQDRSRDAQDREGRPGVRARRALRTTTRSRVFADQPYKQRDHREGPRRQRRRRGRGRSRRRRRRVDLPQRRRRWRRVHRPVPRAARAVDRQARRVQADEGRGRVLAGQRKGPDAPAHLRHRMGVAEGARRVPASHRGSRTARPPQARRRARSLLVPRRDRFRPRGVPPEGRHRPAGDGGVLAPAPRSGRLRVREHAAHLQGRACSTSRATSTGSPTACSRRCTSTRAARAARAPTTTSSR